MKTTFEFKEPVTRPSMPIPKTRPVVSDPKPIVTAVPRQSAARPSVRELVDSILAEFKQAKTAVVISFATGTAMGLVILGWWLWPVQWVDAQFTHLAQPQKQIVIEMAADLAAYDVLNAKVAATTYNWMGIDSEICALSATEPDLAQRARLVALAYRVNGVGCGEKTSPQQ